MKEFYRLYKGDLVRYGGEINRFTKRWHYLFRKTQTCRFRILKSIFHYLLLLHGARKGIEIDYPVQIDTGLYIGHPYCITINDEVIIGKNCNIHKNVTIGQENRGKRKGAPVIGDNCWLGIGCVIVGHVMIGSNVLIAPNSFVNCDVPDNSIVIGNPCKIIHRDDATRDYINNNV